MLDVYTRKPSHAVIYLPVSHTSLDLYTCKPYQAGFIYLLAIPGWIYIPVSPTRLDLYMCKPYQAVFIYL